MQAVNRKQLFLASCIALLTTSLTFAFRASLSDVWGTEFQINNEAVGRIFAPAFWGFTLAMIFGGPLCDWLGMKKLVGLAFICHLAGIITYLVAKDATTLFIGTIFIGIGNGMVEAACNPLVVTLYPDNKTTMLNRFHVWFPGGNVIGGLLAFALLEKLKLDWRYMVGLLFISTIIYGIIFWRLKFPETERVQKGISTRQMFMSCLNPLYIVMIICMFLTAATELGTGTWINTLLEGAGVSGLLVLVLINFVMAMGRSFAGPVVHRLNPNGMLIFSALFAGIGLVLMSQTSGYAMFGAAFIFAVGICFFWPTMLGFVSENLPQTGALGLSLMGGAGMFSVSLILPIMGGWFDKAKAAAVAAGSNAAKAEATAGSESLLKVAIMPAVLLVIFIIIYLVRRKSATAHKAVTA